MQYRRSIVLCRYLERLEDPLEEDVVGVVDLRLLCDVLDLHLGLLLLILLLLRVFIFIAAILLLLLLLLLRMLLLLQRTLLLALLLAVSAPAVFLKGWLVGKL